MNIIFQPMTETHIEPVLEIFNYFIKNSFAAYPEDPVPSEFFPKLLQITQGYPSIVVVDKDREDKVIGFAFMRALHPSKTFRRTAELSYFLLPEYTRKGIGHTIMKYLIEESQKIGIDCLLAEISSLNEQSINFHKKTGFEQCGLFKRAGRKFDQDFDVVWMQKLL